MKKYEFKALTRFEYQGKMYNAGDVVPLQMKDRVPLIAVKRVEMVEVDGKKPNKGSSKKDKPKKQKPKKQKLKKERKPSGVKTSEKNKSMSGKGENK